jgi:hypothetical protein
MPIPLHNNPNSMHLLEHPNPQMSRWLLLALAAFPAAASAGLLESYETSVPSLPAANTAYLTVEQSSTTGVTRGAKSLKIVYNAAATWQWLATNYPAAAYQDWYHNDILLIDVHRPLMAGNSKLNLEMAINGTMGWNQKGLLSWAWMNAGSTSTDTFAFDYRTIRDAAPAPGAGLPASVDYFQLNLMGQSNMEVSPGSGIGGEVYIDNVRFVKALPPLPVSLSSFDETTEAFQHYDSTSPDVSYSPKFGGSLKLAAGGGAANDYFWHLGKEISGGYPSYQIDRLKSLASSGGKISYDVIGQTGTLAGTGFNVAIKVYNTWKFIQVSYTVTANEVTQLDDGNEIARITLDASQFGSDLTIQSGYGFYLGYNGTKEFYFDNLVFAPNMETGVGITFDATAQNFTPLATTTTTWEAGGLNLANPGGSVGGTSAIFTAGSADPQVAAVYAKLVAASHTGGKLRYKIKRIAVTGRSEYFSGFSSVTSLQAGDALEMVEYIPASELTEGGDPNALPPVPATATATNYSHTVEILLDPASAQNPQGILLPADAASYEFHLRNDYDAGDVATLVTRIDDFEVITNAAPDLYYSPPMPTDAGSYVGRVLTTWAPGAVFSATGLPPGLAIDPATGLVHGTPTANGTFHVLFTITGPGTSDSSESMDWLIASVGSMAGPVITSFTYAAGSATMTWTGASSVTVLRSPTMAEGSWEKVSENNSTGTYTDSSAPVGKAFYRVSVP